jgi:hypothetical protein
MAQFFFLALMFPAFVFVVVCEGEALVLRYHASCEAERVLADRGAFDSEEENKIKSTDS